MIERDAGVGGEGELLPPKEDLMIYNLRLFLLISGTSNNSGAASACL